MFRAALRKEAAPSCAGSGEWIRTTDLRVMSPTSYHCSTPRRSQEEYTRPWLEMLAPGATEWPWHRPIFPGLDDPSIVGAGAFHYRVRHGNGWDHSALATRTIWSLQEIARVCEKRSLSKHGRRARKKRAFLRSSVGERQSCRFDEYERSRREPSAISNAQLRTLRCFHVRPIDLLV